MGQFEKIVVLVALLLVTAILVVTFTADEDKLPLTMSDMERAELVEPEGPSSGADLLARDRSGSQQNPRTRRDRSRPGTLAGLEDASNAALEDGAGGVVLVPDTEEPERPGAFDLQARSQKELQRQRAAEKAAKAAEADLLLDDSFDPSAVTRLAGVPEGAALRTLVGLRDTWEEDLKEYVWSQGDSWVGVAERYYGDRRKVELLRQFNEGLSAPRAGDAILVPVFDGRERSAEVETRVDERGAEFYAVVEGDSLWGISKKVYGKGHLWERVFEANRNLLKSPDDVRPGMELYIP